MKHSIWRDPYCLGFSYDPKSRSDHGFNYPKPLNLVQTLGANLLTSLGGVFKKNEKTRLGHFVFGPKLRRVK